MFSSAVTVRRGVAAAAFSIALAIPTAAAAVGPTGEGRQLGDAEPAIEAAGSPRPATEHGLPPIDLRERTASEATPAAGSGTARARLRRGLGAQGVFDLDPRTGTPRVVARLDGYLTGASDAAPENVALGYLRRNAAAFGLDGSDLAGLRLTRDYTDIEGITHLIWAQSVDGVDAFEHGVYANVAADGRLINVMGAPVPDLERVRSLEPGLSPRRALATALADADADGSAPPARESSGPDLETSFAGGHDARLVLFTVGPGDTRLAWRVTANAASTEIYEYVLDASSGEVLLRQNTVDFAAGRVWEYAPNISHPDVCSECSSESGTQALKPFPSDWGTQASKLQGSNAHVYTDVDDNNLPDSPYAACPECGEVGPNSGADWNYSFVPNPHASGGHLSFNCWTIWPQCSWAVTTNPSFDYGYGWRTNLRQNATQVYWYVNRFHDHLEAAPFGFTPAAGNFEGADAVNAEVLDGADTETSGIPGTPDLDHVNNANMLTPADGSPPRMQMYLFIELGSGSIPESNGGDDASVIYHEYVHGLSNRLVLDTAGNPALRSFQARSMGEGWSDWYAMDFLEGRNLDEDDTADNGEMNLGVYLMGGDIHALRTEGVDCARGSGADPDCPGTPGAGSGGYTLGDMGDVIGQPEVHADGEIWAQTLWDLRRHLVATLGGNTFDGTGVTVARSVITRGMELAPPDPSFLEMRNAILQADEVVNGGDHARKIWSVFARRGMGYFATDTGSTDTSPKQDFTRPPRCNQIDCGELTGVVEERAGGQPVAGAVVEIEGPGNLVDVTNASGRYKITRVPPHTYRFVTGAAAGHAPQTARNVTVGTGTATRNFTIDRDWADVGTGAEVTSFSPPDYTSFGCGPAQGFDLSLASGWGSTSISPADPSNGPGGAKTAIVRLPQTIDVTRIAVDPGATCGDDDSASTRRLRIQTSGAGGGPFTTMATRTYDAADNHRLNVYAPTKATANVRRIKVTMLDNQGGGASAANFMDLSEVQIYGTP